MKTEINAKLMSKYGRFAAGGYIFVPQNIHIIVKLQSF